MSLVLVDVGASGGYHSRWQQKIFNPFVILFDPLISEKYIENGLITRNIAIADYHGSSFFNICRKKDTSSLLFPNYKLLNKYPNPSRYDIVETSNINVSTIDIECSNYKIDFLKIDTQGTGLEVLKGASNKLTEIIGVEIEVDFISLYERQKLFSEVDSYLRDKQFQLMDLSRVYWHKQSESSNYYGKGDLIFGDALYFKDPLKIKEIAQQDADRIHSIICCYLAYGYLTQALDFAREFSVVETDLLKNYSELKFSNNLWRIGDLWLGNKL